MPVSLVQSTLEYDKDLLDMLSQIPENETGFIREYGKISKVNILGFLQKMYNNARGINFGDGKARSITYWAYDEKELVGIAKLRPEITTDVENYAGNCGYYVRPELRGRGYGHQIMAALMVEAKKFGLDKILLICHETNIRSKKVILKNGGREFEPYESYLRFYIDL